MTDPKQIVTRFDRLKEERGNFESLWQDVSFFCVPRKSIITSERSIGSELPTDLYTSVGRIASQIFAAGLHSYLTSPTQKWFSLRFRNDALQEDKVASSWLKECEDSIYHHINLSNFSQQVYEVYRDLGVFGTACLYEEEDPEEGIRFYSRPINEIYIIEDARERVSEIFRLFQFTPKQAVSFFGEENVSQTVREAAAANSNDKIDFLHYVGERAERISSKSDAQNKPYASIWIEKETKKLCKEGGYDEFPFFVVRFAKNSMEKYGYSPAINVLPELRMANKMRETILRQGEKQVNPPLDAPEEGYVLPLDISAGAVNYHRLGLGDNDLIRPLLPDITRALPFTAEMIKDTEETIKKAFFVDLFLMLTELPKMTATEVMQRVSEKMMILAPVLGRIMSDLLDPIIKRTFAILMRRNELPPVPQELVGAEYTIDYTSPLARAQKAYDANAITKFLAVIGEMAQVAPEVLDKVDVDKVADEFAKIQGVNPKVLRDDAEVEEIRRRRAEAQQQALQQQQAIQAAEVAAKFAKGGKA